jgi:hypothetical protein
MKPATFGCVIGSAAALLFAGCSDDEYYVSTHDDVARVGYYDDAPGYIERRTVVIDNSPRVVPVYRTGNSYYYTWSGRRYGIRDYPSFARTNVIYRGPAYSSARYRTVDRDWDDRRVVRRTTVRAADYDDVDDLRYRTTTRRVVRDYDFDEDNDD